mgnify:FL=1|jgi:hypothetical protein
MAPLPVVRVRVFRHGCSVTGGVVAEYHPDRVCAGVCRWLWLVQSEQSSFGHRCRYCRVRLAVLVRLGVPLWQISIRPPISPNLHWGNQKLGVSGGHLMPDDMGHWMGDAVGHLVGGVSRFRGTQAADTASCLMHKKKGVRQKVNMVVLRLLKALPLLALGWFCLSLKIQSHDSCTRKQGFM